MKWLSRLVLALALTAPGTWPSFGQSVGGTPYITPTIPFIQQASGPCIATPILLTATGAGTWTNNTNCTSFNIQMIGGGGGGGELGPTFHQTGGGGGQGASLTGLTIGIGATVGYSVGAGGTATHNGNDSWWCSATSGCASSGGANVVLCASGGSKGGQSSGSVNGGAGGSACALGTTNAGGRGGNLTGASGAGGTGGGGAGSPTGTAGGNGGDSSSTSTVVTNGGQGNGAAGGAGGIGNVTAATNGGNGTDGAGCNWGTGGGGGGTVNNSAGSGGNYGGGSGATGNLAVGGNGAICILPQGGYTGPGDYVSGATEWHGWRAYSAVVAAAATQKAVNIRRASDNETCDFPIASSGDLGLSENCSGSDNNKSLATFLTSTTGAGTEWYDQTGNGNNQVQTTAANQPTVTVSCLNSKPCFNFVAASTLYFKNTGAANVNVPNTYSFVAVQNGANANSTLYDVNLNTGSQSAWDNGSDNTIYMYQGSFLNGVQTRNSWHAFQEVFATSGYLNVDNANIATGNPGGASSSTGGLFIGAKSDTSAPSNMSMTEFGWWGGVGFNPGQQTNVCHSEYVYWATSVSC